MAMVRTGKHRRLAYDRSEADALSDGESSADRSSDNEYAEGLGCAHARRFVDGQRTQFEFDNHDREEYFEQPRSHQCTRVIARPGRHIAQDYALSVAHESGRQPMSSALRDLESAESHSSGDERAAENRDRQLAIIARRAERRAERRVLIAQGALPAKAPARSRHTSKAPASICDITTVAPAADSCAEWTRLWDNVSTLAALRCRAEEHRVASVDAELAWEALEVLKTVRVTAKLLQTTGAGLELNRAFWRCHASAEVAAACRLIVTRWRAEISAKRRREVG